MRNLSLNAKFLFVLSIFVAASITISVLGITKLGALNDELNNIVEVLAKRSDHANNIQIIVNEIRVQEKVIIMETSDEGMRKIVQRLEEEEKALRTEIQNFKAIALEQGKKQLDEAISHLDEWKVVSLEIRKLALEGNNEQATVLARGKAVEIFDKIAKIAADFTERNEAFMAEAAKNTDALYENARLIMIIVSVSAILFGLGMAFFILRALNRAINQVITNLNDGSAQVTSAAQQIASSSEELSQAATEQASSLEETSSAVEEMNSMVSKNADSAKQSTDVSHVTADSAVKGKRVVEDMIRSMQDINAANNDIMKQTNESNQQFAEIVKVIGEIGNKTKVINEIVFQTKLLSFNASVEAARAGEHGKGFAVVAEEVGNLAQMSGNAAKEITSMLDSSIQKVESIVNQTKTSIQSLIAESRSKVESGTNVAKNCGEVLEEIVTNVSRVTQMSQSISTASDEQARGISEITRAIGQLDQVTQQNAAASEETASSAEELSAQAESMRGVVQTLIQTIKGGDGHDQGRIPTYSEKSVMASASSASRTEKTGQLLHLGKKSKGSARSMPMGEVKMAVGSNVVPSENDPRFKDV